MMGTKKVATSGSHALKTEITADEVQKLISTLTNPRIAEAKKKKLFVTTYHIDVVHAGSGGTLLLEACQLRYYPLVKWLVDAGADVNKGDLRGVYPLHYAVQVSLEMTKLLIETGARLDPYSDAVAVKCTPLIQSILSNQYSPFIYLLAKDVDINFLTASKICSLYAAAQQTEIKFLIQLLKRPGIIIDNPDADGNTPLLTAVDKRNPEAVKLLLQAGANIYHQNTKGVTVFHIVAENGDEAILKVLLEHRSKHPVASIDIRDGTGNTPLHLAVCNRRVLATQLFLESGASANTQNDSQCSPLCEMIASAKGTGFDSLEKSIFKLLRDNKVDINQINKIAPCIHTPLSTAISYGKTNIAILLLFHDANPVQEVQIVITDYKSIMGDNPGIREVKTISKLTPFHMAVINQEYELVESMIARKSHIDVLDETNCTPLFHACLICDTQMLKLLLEAGASPNIPNSIGETPFWITCFKGTVEQVNLFFNPRYIKPDINSQNTQGHTPLHNAAVSGRLDIVRLLCQKGATVNISSKDGATPLFMAAQEGHLDVVEFLLTQGADAGLRRLDGNSPLEIAFKYKHQGVMDRLAEEEAKNVIDLNKVSIHIASQEELITENGARYISFSLSDPVPPPPPPIPAWASDSQFDKPQSAHSFLKEKGLLSESQSIKQQKKLKRAVALLAPASGDNSAVKKEATKSDVPESLIVQQSSDADFDSELINESEPEETQSDDHGNDASSLVEAATTVSAVAPALQPPSAPIVRSIPAPGKLQVIFHGPVNFDPASLRKPPALDSSLLSTGGRSDLVPPKPRLQFDSANDPSLIDQILQEAIALSNELNPPGNCVNPLFISNDIDRLSLRFDTFQMFHKIYLLIDHAHQDIIKSSLDNPLVSTLKSFCDGVRKFRNMMVHRPNYVDTSFEEEVKQFIVSSGFVSWCTELREYAKNLAASAGKPTSDVAGAQLSRVFLTLTKRIVSLQSYQQLENSWNIKISFDECYEQLLFAIKLIAFNEEKSETYEPYYYKQRREKASSMLAAIIDEYGYYAQVHLSSDDFEKIKATPLYQATIQCKKKYGSSDRSLLWACHQFRNKKVSHLAEESAKSESDLLTVEVTPEIKELKKHAKKICEMLGVKHVNDAIKAPASMPGETPIILTDVSPVSTNSHGKILSSLKSDAPDFTAVQSRLNPNAPIFKPQNPSPPILSPDSPLMPTPILLSSMGTIQKLEELVAQSLKNTEAAKPVARTPAL
jgi:ankyrin repeat protein